MGEKLDSRKEKQLEKIGVVWDILNQQWKNYYSLLVKYKDLEGDCNVPYNHKEDGEKLGPWLNTQRILNNKGKLDTGRHKLLEDLGVVWDMRNQQWENYFTLLVKYKDREGDCKIPNNHKEDGENLGHWLNKQRQALKKDKLDAARVQRLVEIGAVRTFKK